MIKLVPFVDVCVAQSAQFADWIAEHTDDIDQPATVFVAIRESDGKTIGVILLRHKLSEQWQDIGGHLAYIVAEDERGKGYATEMLRLALGKCAELGMRQVYITCRRENVASARAIIKNGGVLEKELEYKGMTLQRYNVQTKSY